MVFYLLLLDLCFVQVLHNGVKTNQYPFNSHGQQVYKKGNRYITPDVDSHNGGVWKIFDNKGKRLGTADANLRIFKK